MINLNMSNNSYDPYFPWEGVVTSYLRVDKSKRDADNFTSVWIAFNGWMKGQFGTKETDRQLINSTIEHVPINTTFESLKRDIDYAATLGSFSEHEVLNHKTSKIFRYDGTFGSLVETLYALRGNTIHGTDTSGMNSDIHSLACEILYIMLWVHIYKKFPRIGI